MHFNILAEGFTIEEVEDGRLKAGVFCVFVMKNARHDMHKTNSPSRQAGYPSGLLLLFRGHRIKESYR